MEPIYALLRLVLVETVSFGLSLSFILSCSTCECKPCTNNCCKTRLSKFLLFNDDLCQITNTEESCLGY